MMPLSSYGAPARRQQFIFKDVYAQKHHRIAFSLCIGAQREDKYGLSLFAVLAAHKCLPFNLFTKWWPA